MEFTELLEQIKQFEGTDEYNNYVNSLINDDRVNTYLGTENGKKLIQPTLDKYYSKGLETWKANNLEKLINEGIKAKYPEADPRDIELKKLQSEIDKIRQESIHKDLSNKALKVATEKGLPVELIDYFIGYDEDTTNCNLETLEKVFNEKVSHAVDKKFETGSYTPPSGDDAVLSGVEKAFRELNPNL